MYSYDALSRRTQADYANNTQCAYTYDNADRLLGIVNSVKGGSTISSYSYSYDKVGNRLSIVTPEATHNYTYDSIYQLLQASVSQPLSTANYNYDALGNRTAVSDGAATTDYEANLLNQYSTVGNQNYTYDKNGNLTSDGSWAYSYDHENRLSSAVKGTVNAAYKYDALGKRMEKSVNNTTSRFIYDGDQIVAEYDTSGNLVKKYIYGPGIDEPIEGQSLNGTTTSTD